jgi:DNA repair protein RadC
MGKVKAQVLKAALELARRVAAERIPDRPSVRTPAQVAEVLGETARVLDQEVLWVMMLDTKYRLLRAPEEISRGILDANLVHPREVFRRAVGHAAAAVILVHNHPSGDTAPSAEDIRVTRQMVEAGRLMDIEVLDHVILGCPSKGSDEAFYSLRESGLVDFG